ncbi:MAG: TetR/AcrR family transcriptional regulator [Deltaproteobacteria bacterium]|nr:TetR/AcrR family transcriptional regulator [Deltaproteobacteria bacterium]MBW2447312.1 TetR/AcrR family transcriptional regulator [Deltaproteobacteria bacterium]
MPRSLSAEEVESFRSELCRVATRQFAEAGYDGVTLRGLANELGVSPMTPYRYFENKEAIFESVRASAFDRFGDHTTRTREATNALPPIEQLRAMGKSYVEFAIAEPHDYRIMFEVDHLMPNDDAFIEERRARCWDQILAVTRRCIAEGAMDGDPLLIAHLCWVTLHGLVTLHLSGKLQVGFTLEELLEPTLQTILRGAAPTPSAVGEAR